MLFCGRSCATDSASGIALAYRGWSERDIRRTIHATEQADRLSRSPADLVRGVLVPGNAVVIAYCWANGVIELGRHLPEGAIEVARGGQEILHRAISATAAVLEDGSFCLPSPYETIEPARMLAALEDYIAWLSTLDLGVQVNYPVESLYLLHQPTEGHGLKCAGLHDALRQEFSLDAAEAELACLLLQKSHLPVVGTGVNAQDIVSPASLRTLLAKTGSPHLVDLMQRLASVVV